MYDLKRFTNAQANTYQTALAEIKSGKKESHWMWYIFPQIQGLGFSDTSKFYAISNLAEAKEYVNDPVLGARLKEISAALMNLDASDSAEVFGRTDNKKLRSSMTLFSEAAPDEQVFKDVLKKFFKGKKDRRTLSLIEKNGDLKNK